MNRLSGKTAVVSGGAKGIGQAIAQMFAEEGAWVLILDTDADGEETVESIRDSGGAGMFYRADVADEAAVTSAVKLTAAERNGIDIVCNNAAYLGPGHAVLESTREEWTSCIQVSLMGTHHVTKAALPHMLQKTSGSIINISSIQALTGCPDSIAYTATKSALLGYTLSAAYDYGKQNIRVNAICPGPIQTRISPKPGTGHYEWQVGNTMLGRVGSAREIGAAAVFLASDEASYITGVMLPVDGGWTAK